MTNPTNENSELERKLIPVVTEIEPVEQGRSLVVVIGINEYVHWQKLKNAVQDAVGIQQALIDKLGFTAPSFSPLLDSAATKMAIESLIEDQLRNFLEEDDSLILFFAGHGSTRVEKVGGKTTGFLVPVEADKSWSSYIKIEPFLEAIGSLPARHILVILDSCFSGIALGRAMRQFRDAIQYTEDLGKRRSRKVITSARYEQTALDGGPIPGHSLFTGTLIDGLNWGKADTDANGFITSFELGHFLQSQVGNESNHKQTPDYGTFCDDIDERGEMVISLRNQSFDKIKARAFSALQSGKFTTFKELVQQLTLLKPSSPEALYLEYRLKFLENDFKISAEVIEQLLEINPKDGVILLSHDDLWNLQAQFYCWQPVLTIPEVEFPLEVAILVGPKSSQLKEAKQEKIGETIGYFINYKDRFQLSIKNSTESSMHIYMVEIDSFGRFEPVTLWDDEDVLLDGLPAGETKLTYPFVQTGSAGICELRLFSSPKRLRFFLFPAAPGTRGYAVEEIKDSDLKMIKMKSIRYSMSHKIV